MGVFGSLVCSLAGVLKGLCESVSMNISLCMFIYLSAKVCEYE